MGVDGVHRADEVDRADRVDRVHGADEAQGVGGVDEVHGVHGQCVASTPPSTSQRSGRPTGCPGGVLGAQNTFARISLEQDFHFVLSVSQGQ